MNQKDQTVMLIGLKPTERPKWLHPQAHAKGILANTARRNPPVHTASPCPRNPATHRGSSVTAPTKTLGALMAAESSVSKFGGSLKFGMW
jgi:hypothetical protein